MKNDLSHKIYLDASAAEKARTFRNEDLQKFQLPTVPENPSTQGPPPREESSSGDLSEDRDNESWRLEETFCRECVDKAKLIIVAEEDLRSAKKSSKSRKKNLMM